MDLCSIAEQTPADYLRALYKKATKLGVPIGASMEITERCNLTCVHCYLGDQEALRPNRSRELTTEQWKSVIDQIADVGCLTLLITGGDPFLRRDFADIYRHAKRRGLLVTIFCNGTLITEAIAQLFRELPPSRIEISLYGATEETYERVTGIKGSYRNCISGIERLREAGVRVALKTVVLSTNQHEFHEIAAMARTMGTERFRFEIDIQGAFGQDLTPLSVRLSPEEAVRVEFSDEESFQSWQKYSNSRLEQKLAEPEQLYTCGAGKSNFHVNPYGQLQPCLTTRYLGYDLLGGSLVEGLATLRGDLREKKASTHLDCNSCGLRMLCSSCPATSMQETGAEDRPTLYQCQLTHERHRLIEQAQGREPKWTMDNHPTARPSLGMALPSLGNGTAPSAPPSSPMPGLGLPSRSGRVLPMRPRC